ncbi:hypothetical protein MYSTI_07039 [Myxococcus stipitatus DSM 14675]|uniref:Uncharacterized protein n=1 Tax=Myxococcus stipitatus (strain DSM 14675 / JCM 12634 / Mx s8) TaxID=1278073 RepID=L7UH50_MYXSD|nr:hypothetical protein [Myxococcus stipitatus]AGC48311.1 hypothetical protein MYSTI_07039 [Myxococcus stipitatus DSM 14675]
MSRINHLTGPRVQAPTQQAAAASSSVGFGSRLQQQNSMMSAAARPGDPLMSTGGLVVQSALASVGGSSHSGMLNSYLSAVGRGPISPEGGAAAGAGAAKPGSQQAEEQKVMTELAELSAATLNNSIFHMGNRMKVDLERE